MVDFNTKYTIGNIPVRIINSESEDFFEGTISLKKQKLSYTTNELFTKVVCQNKIYEISNKDIQIFKEILKAKHFDLSESKRLPEEEKSFLNVFWHYNEIQQPMQTAAIIQHFYSDVTRAKQDTPLSKEENECIQYPNMLFDMLKENHIKDDLSDKIPENIHHTNLLPNLRKYQIEAVRWMLHREYNENVKDILNPLYHPVKTPDGSILYYSSYFKEILPLAPLIKTSTSGGILADEMGLGKTVEVLALTLMNQRDLSAFDQTQRMQLLTPRMVDFPSESISPPKTDEPVKPKRKSRKVTKPKKESQLKIMLRAVYEREIGSMSTTLSRRRKEPEKEVFRVRCFCGDLSYTPTNVIACAICFKVQHFNCLYSYHKNQKVTDAHICPQCWTTQPLFKSAATLIVSPFAISTQWENEIKKHTKKGKVRLLIYKGIKKGWIPPNELVEYDIILTTYNVLRSEIYFTKTQQIETSRFRHKRKYDSLISPLTCIEWWRICLDEAQMVESGVSNAAAMVKLLPTIHRWAVTGTPIQKSVADLYGLIDFLDIEPYNSADVSERFLFEPYTEGNYSPLVNLLSKIMWRTCKIDVEDQVNIPPQSHETIWLDFSAAESFFYKQQHAKSAENLISKLNKYTLSRKLKSFDVGTLNKMLLPLLSLRQDCTQPKVMTSKAPLTMQELLKHLINKTQTEAEEALRLCVSNLNGMAGLFILQCNFSESYAAYKEVLRISAKYEDTLHVDSLQRIHTLSNICEVMIMIYGDNLNYITDDTNKYKRMCSELELRYLRKFFDKLIQIQNEQLLQSINGVEKCLNDFSAPMGDWCGKMINWFMNNNLSDQLEQKVRLDITDLFGSPFYEKTFTAELNTIFEMQHAFKTWLGDLYKEYESIGKILQDLHISEIDAISFFGTQFFKKISKTGRDCHLRPVLTSGTTGKKAKCLICKFNKKIKAVECLIYHMAFRKNNFKEQDIANKGSWQPSYVEWMIKSFISFARNKNAPQELVEDGDIQLLWIESIKKEFKEWNRYYTHYLDLVSASDELTLCKTRMQLKVDDYIPNSSSTDVSRSMRTLRALQEREEIRVHHFFEEDEVAGSLRQFQVDRQISEQNVVQKHLSFMYLKNLQNIYKEGMQSNPELCPVCRESLGKQWTVLACGHCFCIDCVQVLISSNRTNGFNCCVCRVHQNKNTISYVSSQLSKSISEETKVTGWYSTKIDGIVNCVLNLLGTDPDVKIIIFSTWGDMLECIAKALLENKVKYRLQTGSSGNQIYQFKDPKFSVTCLLMPLRYGSKGLNLIEATHVILMEPILNPGDELQAIGRVHRIGQTKPTFVHRFIVKNTIEERIHNIVNTCVENSSNSNWNDKDLTLSQLADLFTEYNDLSNAHEPMEIDLDQSDQIVSSN